MDSSEKIHKKSYEIFGKDWFTAPKFNSIDEARNNLWTYYRSLKSWVEGKNEMTPALLTPVRWNLGCVDY